jgi:hypothetical protein
MLARDSSAFSNMFKLPSKNGGDHSLVEGSSDANPIRLHGDSLKAFRSLLGILYALWVVWFL